MASINQRNGKIFFDFRWQGRRHREYCDVPDTPDNRKRAEAVLKQITLSIKRGDFVLADYFPDSPRAAEAATSPPPALRTAPSAPVSDRGTNSPDFKTFAETWFQEMRPQWRRSYASNLRVTLDAHLIPRFGHQEMHTISKSEILAFRAKLTEPTEKRPTGLSASRINHIMCLLRQVLDEAAERYHFISPYRNIKPMRIPRTEVQPFNLKEINLIFQSVCDEFRPYYIVRILTGLRTAEIDGLQWQYVDFERKQILIRQTLVDGHLEETKTAGSYRTVDMSPPVMEALREQQERTGEFDYVFCDNDGVPLDHRQVTKKIWYPLLKAIGLKRRRPYQTRHTAATLWLAAGENPQWIAAQLGHSAQMLFDTYARFVPNLTRKDGSAFESLLERALEPSEGVKDTTDDLRKITAGRMPRISMPAKPHGGHLNLSSYRRPFHR